MHTRQLPAKAGNCGYAKPLASIRKKPKSIQESKFRIRD